MKRLSIIGSSRFENLICPTDESKRELYERMKEKIITIIVDEKITCLVPGGSSWIDHIAVDLFLQNYVPSLELYLPCDLVMSTTDRIYRFDDKSRCGSSLNERFKDFSRCMNEDKIQNIIQAMGKGAKISVKNGFYRRNILVATKTDILVALTFDNGDKPKQGGTLHTWKNTLVPKRHYYIGEILQ